jgi:hypothetical protein
MGEEKTLTVAARRQGIDVGDEVAIATEPGGVIELLTPKVALKPHTRREDVLVGQIRLRPLIEGEATMVTASLGHRTADALAEVRPSRELVEEPITPPEVLGFEHPSYRVGWHKQKKLTLVAPADVVAEYGEDVRIESSDSGLVVRTPKVKLEYDESVDFYRATVVVEGRVLHAKGTVIARLADVTAETQVKVTRKEEGPAYRIQLLQDEQGSFRATVEKEEKDGEVVSIIKVWGRHPAIRAYLGDAFEGQNSPVVRAMISEIVADVSSRIIVSELFRVRRTTEDFDAGRFYREHYKRMTKFLPRFQRVLIGEPEAARTATELSPAPLLEAEPRAIARG